MRLRKNCPACGNRLNIDTEFGSGRATHWYQLSPVRNFCASCHWVVYFVVLLLALGALILLNVLKRKGAIASPTFDHGVAVLAIFVALGGLVFRSCWRYEAVR